MKANDEIGRVRKRSELTAAQFTLADAGVNAELVASAGGDEAAPAKDRNLSFSLQKGLVLSYSFDPDERGKVTDKSGKHNEGTVR